MTDGNKTDGSYVVKWYGTLHELQKDADGFQVDDVVCNDTQLNPIQQARHWYTLITIETFVRVHNVLADNLDLQKPSLFLKLPNTCNHWETAQKGAMKLSSHLHKGFLDDIIQRGTLGFIDHEEDEYQQEE